MQQQLTRAVITAGWHC